MGDFWSAAGFSTPPSPPDAAAPPAGGPAASPAAPAKAPAPAKPAAAAPARPAAPAVEPDPLGPSVGLPGMPPALGSSTGLPGMPPPRPAKSPSPPKLPPKSKAAAEPPPRPRVMPMTRDPDAFPQPRQPQRGSPAVPGFVTLLVVAGGAFAAYRYINRPPAPATANLTNRPAVKAPADPLLDFLLDEDEPAAPAPTTKPAAAPQPELIRIPQVPDDAAAPQGPRMSVIRTKPAPAPTPVVGGPRNPDNFAPVGLHLQGIDGKMCMINDRMYYVGDRVDNYIVQKISEDTVVLRTGRTLIELKLD